MASVTFRQAGSPAAVCFSTRFSQGCYQDRTRAADICTAALEKSLPQEEILGREAEAILVLGGCCWAPAQRMGWEGGRGKMGGKTACTYMCVCRGAEAPRWRRGRFLFLFIKVSSCGMEAKLQSAKFEGLGRGEGKVSCRWVPFSQCQRFVRWAVGFQQARFKH